MDGLEWFRPAELEYLLRIVLAAVCGGTIGFEREHRFKSAGIRTHLIVALSAALMTVISKYGFFDVAGNSSGITVDASRVTAGVVTAIGFLGAGVIFFRKDTVSGVTTAAGLWATVGVGIAIGAGLYVTGGISTVLIIIVQVLLHRRTPLIKAQKAGVAVLRIKAGDSMGTVYHRLEELVERIEGIELRRLENGQLELRCEVIFHPDFGAGDLFRDLKELPELHEVEIHLH